MEQYNMDGIYYRVERDGEWQDVCFSDCELEEIENFTTEYGAEQWKRVAIHLAEKLRDVGVFLKNEGYVQKEVIE